MKNRFEINNLKGRLSRIRDRMQAQRIPPRLLFILMGVISTLWFLIRVIPKPSRAGYPCMKVAAPFMSSFVLYLLSLGGSVMVLKKARQNFFRTKYFLAGLLVVVGLVGLFFSFGYHSLNLFAEETTKTGPGDGPNQPIGTGKGVNPGRVVWVWNPAATNESCKNVYDFYKPENTSQGVVNKMVVDGITTLAGKSNLKESWEALFSYFNRKKGRGDKPYTTGEKIFIKINQGTANSKLRETEIKNGFYIPDRMTGSEEAQEGFSGTCETNPNVVLEILRELVYVVGVRQEDIAIGDPISHIFGHNYDTWATEFPGVVYADRESDGFGRTLIYPTENDLIFYSDKRQSDKLYDVIEQADYLINAANLKPHGRAGISLTAKNHFGSHARKSAFHLHYSLISPISLGHPTNNGYKKYRVQVDIMGSKYLGENTVLYIVDGLYGGGSNETKAPVKYFTKPFSNDWCNSVFFSQDQVALESVCYDFLRTEWNGSVKHSEANNDYESIPNVNGVDDYLHQAADQANWPDDIIYDPDNLGKVLGSLGAHEHWNNAVAKQYSRNLGKNRGIELVAIPDSLIGQTGSEIYGTSPIAERTVTKTAQSFSEKRKDSATETNRVQKGKTLKATVVEKHFSNGIKAADYYSVVADENNIKWFLTEKGLVSFDGTTWKSHRDKVPQTGLREIDYTFTGENKELWFSTAEGAILALVPMDKIVDVKSYIPRDTAIISKNVSAVAIGSNSVYWFGTDNGIAAYKDGKWLTDAYSDRYSRELFGTFPITAMATSNDGDSLYIATEGAGISRVYRNDVDAVSGASEYIQWGPIKVPSDTVRCICIGRNGTQWFGTEQGVARHEGYKTLEKWTVFTTDDGLISNKVQAVIEDRKGNIWFATEKGVTMFDHTAMYSFTSKDGLAGNNVKCMAIDKDGILWFGTNTGVSSYADGVFTRYTLQKEI